MKTISKQKIKIFEPFLWVYFIWYYIPVVRGYLRFTSINKYFFSFFIIGIFLLLVQMVFDRKRFVIRVNALFPVLIYMGVFLIMCMFDIGNSNEHIRVSFTFWGSLIVYYLSSSYKDACIRLCKLMCIALLITFCTSLIGVILNPHAGRILTYASNSLEEDQAFQMMNIGGLAFFQCLVILIPILLTSYIKNRNRLICAIGIAVIFLALTSASFTISLLVFVIAILITYYKNINSKRKTVVLIFWIIIALLIPWVDILSYLSEIIKNETIAARFESIALSSKNNTIVGNLESRIDLYWTSFKTFIENPWGGGPLYSFIEWENGIGYHSQILDDMARYGIFAIAFYIVFFKEYLRMICNQWEKIDMRVVGQAILYVYIIFLFLNPGFTSSHESVMLFIIIPLLPEVVLERRLKRNISQVIK